MGRWAQQRRRGGGGGAGVPITPPVPRSVVSFFWDGGAAAYKVFWDDTIDYDGSGTLFGVQVDAEDPSGVTSIGPTSLQLNFPTASGSGTTWAVNSQPAELGQPVVFPETGTTS